MKSFRNRDQDRPDKYEDCESDNVCSASRSPLLKGCDQNQAEGNGEVAGAAVKQQRRRNDGENEKQKPVGAGKISKGDAGSVGDKDKERR